MSTSGGSPDFRLTVRPKRGIGAIIESKHQKMCFNQVESYATAMKPEIDLDLDLDLDLERLPQLPRSELVKIVVQQQLVIEGCLTGYDITGVQSILEKSEVLRVRRTSA
ncbi:MAG: hypothetical protein RIE73_04640 [Coleofasciculus sp. C1-SOL-03]|uniref:hypothetical protein n=1 Tax=Coleofasciculus sp. C1-SOL-03 TaxID=3069522 RepID=UPI0032F909FD